MTAVENNSNFHWERAFAGSMARLRAGQGMSQNELAKRLSARGLPFYQATVQRVESGERSVRLDEACAIAEFFEVSLDSMMTSFEGSMESAAYSVARVRRHAEGIAESFSDDYNEFLNEVGILVVSFDELLEASGHTPTPEVVWVAAWLLKCGRLIGVMGDAEALAESIYNKSDSWSDGLRRPTPEWDDVAWIADESAEIWQKLPEIERPQHLMNLNPADLQQWISGKTVG